MTLDIEEELRCLFGNNCNDCGAMTCYADDSTFTVSSKARHTNQEKITEGLENMKLFLLANKLCINEDKTALLESMNRQRRCKSKGEPPTLTVLNDKQELVTLKTVKSCRLLGVNMGEDLTWNAHLLKGEKPLLASLRKQTGIIKFLSKNMKMSSRKTLAEGLVLSRIKYLLPLWGGTTENLLRKIQVIINNTARAVTGLGKRTSTLTLMTKCGWLTIKELVTYFTITEIWKNLHLKSPRYFYSRFNLDEDGFILIPEPRLKMTRRSYKWRASNLWNQLNPELRSCKSLSVLKRKMKKWLMEQRSVNNMNVQ